MKTTMSYHPTSVRMAIIKKTTNNKYWRWCEEKRIFVFCWWDKVVQPPWKILHKFLKKLQLELPSDPAILFLGIYQGKKKVIWKYTWTPMFTAALLTIAKLWEQPKCPSTDNKEDVVYNGVPLSHKTEWNFAICNNTDRLGGFHTKCNKSDIKDKYCMIALICGI